MTIKAERKYLKRFEEEGKKRGLSPRLLEFYQKLFRIQSRAGQRIGIVKPALKEAAINEQLEQGLPLVNFDEITLDWSLLKEVFDEVIALFASYADLFGEPPGSLGKLKSYPSLYEKIAKAWLKKARLPSAVAAGSVDEYLYLEAVTHATLKPFLASYSKALLGFVDQERWRREHCPICGGKPDLAFLDKERGARWLLCSCCDTSWLFQRLQCPYCGTQDQNDLAYFIDDEGVYRLYVCEKCHKYIKAIDLRHTESEILLPLERVLTLDMDGQGQEKGYSPNYPEALTGMIG